MHSLTNKLKGTIMAKAPAKKTAAKKVVKKAAPKKVVKKVAKKVVKKAAPKKAVKKTTKPLAAKKVVKKAAAKKVVKKAAPKKVAKKAAPKKAAKKASTKPLAAKQAVKKAAPKKAAVKSSTTPKPATPKGPFTKGDIVAHLAYKLDVPKKKADEFLNELNSLVASNAKKTFTLPGLGKFSTYKTKKRNGINPKDKSPLVIPAKNKVKFKVSKTLTDAVFK